MQRLLPLRTPTPNSLLSRPPSRTQHPPPPPSQDPNPPLLPKCTSLPTPRGLHLPGTAPTTPGVSHPALLTRPLRDVLQRDTGAPRRAALHVLQPQTTLEKGVAGLLSPSSPQSLWQWPIRFTTRPPPPPVYMHTRWGTLPLSLWGFQYSTSYWMMHTGYK